MECPCGKGPSVDECCGPYIDVTKAPETAEALMRSRYTAYALGKIDHLVATHDPETAGDLDPVDMARWANEATWQGIEVLATEAGGPQDETGVVEFVARFSLDGEDRELHERSVFRRIEGNWFYVGDEEVKQMPIVRSTPKVGRNAPCPCGSGKKFKKCCGR